MTPQENIKAERAESALTAAQQSAKEQFGAGVELLEESLKLCCCKDGDGDFIHPALAIRINLFLNTIREAAKEVASEHFNRKD